MSAEEEEVLEEGTGETPEGEVNPLDLSDDAFNELPEPTDTAEEGTDKDAEELQEETTQESSEEEPESEAEETEPDLAAEPNLRDAYADASGSDESDDSDTEAKATTEDTETQDTDTSDVDYKAEYQKLLAPFRANGKEMKVASVDDAITLMKMGANYNKKMAGLKPSLRILKMLEKNELLDESKLSYLIDLDKKNPEAITKLLKDSGVDPLDVDTEKNTDYKPSTYTVDDKEVELDTVLDDIRDTKSYPETIDIVGNKWDEASKKEVLADPNIIRIINDHVAAGIYGQIMDIVENERMLGKLTNMSDLDAYKHVGNVLQANGAFNKKATPAANTATQPPVKKAQDPKLNTRRKAASSTKGAPSKPTPKDFNPLSLSDEEFEKIAGSQYM